VGVLPLQNATSYVGVIPVLLQDQPIFSKDWKSLRQNLRKIYGLRYLPIRIVCFVRPNLGSVGRNEDKKVDISMLAHGRLLHVFRLPSSSEDVLFIITGSFLPSNQSSFLRSDHGTVDFIGEGNFEPVERIWPEF